MLIEQDPENGAVQVLSRFPTDYRFEFGGLHILLDTTLDATRIEEWTPRFEQLGASPDQDLARAARICFEGLPCFWVLWREGGPRILLGRDRSGIKTGYVVRTPGGFLVGNLSHQLADRLPSPELSLPAVWSLLYTGFLAADTSLYRGVTQIEPGGCLILHPEGRIESCDREPLPVQDEEDSSDYPGTLAGLRAASERVHRSLASRKENRVLLSGGIDSAVMAACLVDAPGSRACTVRVQGTGQDETPFAQAQADHLGMPLEVSQVDPAAPISREAFRNRVRAMNNPYIGIWLFQQMAQGTSRTYFAGQDTRLHTPSINLLDRVLFALQWWRPTPGRRAFRACLRGVGRLFPAGGAAPSSPKLLRGLRRLALAGDLDAYFNTYFLHWGEGALSRYRLPGRDFSAARPHLAWEEPRGPRQTYNAVVRYNWGMQYCFDTLYMQDLGRILGTYVAMPFYHPALTEVSSRLPWRKATRFRVGRSPYGWKPTLINKVLLRDAFAGAICPEVYYRDKATSDQLVELLRGALGRTLREILREDMDSPRSLVGTLGLGPTLEPFLREEPGALKDVAYGVLVHYIAALCVLGPLAAQPV